ncbi:uncharacterized protein AMSG_01163 [Thecamonas trahens ATCC 50062]|uniref:RNB domain-containing protein n=1 Tax=Thecamonas trahens ATCC 50062 TaxID=461836 RepID=A0A0L0DME9_THETB|nr:hypothetical protein AMSG_01163 [Thecamonas trahens ATCC 50062]KNC53450.1 hypothetical protein AMSG_01163 [Thecamonas trahens ATCC 50062]|eukprot:XP_013761774.1 hypothetical protein AMSG_01163 [Thecamonas trahens ATCC 50062]
MARELRSALRSASVGSLTVLPLDNVQGLEFEVIFLLTDGKSVDRLARLVHQPRRMNTAISRARNLVVTVGHVPDILEDPAWHMYGHTCAFGADTFSRFLSMMAMRAVLPAAPGKIAALLDTLESTIDSLQIFAQDAEWSTTFFAPAKALAASLPFVQEILAVELAAVDAAKAKQSTAEPALSFAKTFKAPAELGFVPPSPTASPSPFPQLRASADSHAHAEYDAAQARSRSAAQAQAQAQAVSKVAQAAQSDAPAPAPQAKASTPTGGPPGFDAAPAPQASPSPRPAPMDTAPKQLPATVAAIIGPLITEYCGALEMEPIALVAPEAQTFTAAALDEAVTASAPTPQDELKRRLETTAARFSAPGASVPPRCFTLTEPHARDPQVALTLTGLQQDGQGNVSRVRIGVHVADLAARLRAGGELEAAILARDQTLHINLPDGSKVRRALFPSILEKTAALAADGTPKLTVSLALDIAMEPATGKWAVASSAFVETAWLIDENVTFAAAESSPLFELLFAMTDDLRAARCGGKGTTRPEYAIEYLRAAHPPQPVVRNRTASRARSALDELCITYASLAGAALKASATEDCPVLLAAEPAPSVQTMEALERTLERLGGDAADVTSAVRKLREWHTADDTPSSPGAKYAVRGAKKQSRGKKQRGKSLVWHDQTPTAADAKPPAALGALTSQTLREAVEAALGRGRTRYLAVTKSNTATPHVFHGVAAFAPVTSPLRSAAHVLAQQRLKAAVIGSSVAVTVGVKDIVQELSTKAANCGRASIKLERALFLASLQAAPLTARGMVVEILRSGAMPTGVRLFVPELAWAWPGGRGALPGIVVPLGALGSVVSTSSYARASSKSAPEVVIAQETADGKNSLALVPFTTEVCVLVGARPVGDSGKLSPALLTAWLGTKPSGPGCCVAHTTSPRAWLDANDPLDTSAGPSSSSDVGGGAVATSTVPGAEVHALKAGIVCTGMAVYTASSSAPPGLETTGRSKLFTDATVTWRNDGCGVVELPMWTVQPRPVARQLFACVRSASGSAHCAVSRIRPLPDAPETMELTLQPLADAASGVFSARLLAVAAVELFVLPAVYASQLEILEAATAVGEGAVERNSRPPALSALMSTPSPVRTPAKLRTTFKAPSFVIGDTENVPGGLLVLPSSLPEAARALVGAGEVMVVTSMHARSLASAEDVLNRAGVRYVRAAADEQLWHETSGLHRMLRLRARVNGELVPAISELVDLTAPEARSENHLDLLVYNDAKVGGALRELEASARSASREQAEKLVKEYFGLWQAAAHRILTRSVLVAPTAAFARGRLLAGLRPAVTAVAIPASVSTEAALTTELIVPAARTRNRVLVYRR